jgi:hypothetical protein
MRAAAMRQVVLGLALLGCVALSGAVAPGLRAQHSFLVLPPAPPALELTALRPTHTNTLLLHSNGTYGSVLPVYVYPVGEAVPSAAEVLYPVHRPGRDVIRLSSYAGPAPPAPPLPPQD